MNGKLKPENGYNADILMHRFYGAVEIDGVVYRAKSTIKEFKDKNTALKPYSYEITKIELLSPNSEYANNGTSKPSGTITDSISATKLLQNVEKSYDLGKKVLEESAIYILLNTQIGGPLGPPYNLPTPPQERDLGGGKHTLNTNIEGPIFY